MIINNPSHKHKKKKIKVELSLTLMVYPQGQIDSDIL